jgi:uncharacterized damage-inducible protein DinB
MSAYGAKELADSFRTVRKNTIAVAKDIPAEKYSFRPAPDTRSVGETLIHIANSHAFQLQLHRDEKRTTLEGVDFPAIQARRLAAEKVPMTKDQIVALLEKNGDEFAKFLEGLDDSFLAERVQSAPGMTPASKSRIEFLMGVKEHEMHHRGQLMTIERILGIVPHLTRERQARMAANDERAAKAKTNT